MQLTMLETTFKEHGEVGSLLQKNAKRVVRYNERVSLLKLLCGSLYDCM